jgi:hypothetical protein
MFEAIIHARRVRRLQKEKRRIQAGYKRIRDEAKAANRSELELQRLFFEERMKIQIVDAEIHQLITLRLIQIAQRNLIPYPEFESKGGAWIQSSATGHWHLTIEAMAQLRAAIRQEKKERAAYALMWLAAWTGLVGTLIGLASLLLVKK